MSHKESGVFRRVDIVGHEALRRAVASLSEEDAEKAMQPFLARAEEEVASLRKLGDADDIESATSRVERFRALLSPGPIREQDWQEFKQWIVTAIEASADMKAQDTLYGLWNYLKAKVAVQRKTAA
jgi:hypothetical protein